MTDQDVLLPTNYNHFIINDKLELLVQYGCDFPFRMNPGPPKQIIVCKMNVNHLQSNGGNDWTNHDWQVHFPNYRSLGAVKSLHN